MSPGFIDTATVYERVTATGVFTTIVKAALACRLVLVRGGDSGVTRAEAQSLRQLLHDPDYDLPARCQVEIGGLRFNPIPASIAAVRGPSGAVLFRRCDLVQAT